MTVDHSFVIVLALEACSSALAIFLNASVRSVHHKEEHQPDCTINNAQGHREPKRQFKKSIHNNSHYILSIIPYVRFLHLCPSRMSQPATEIDRKVTTNFLITQTVAPFFSIFFQKKWNLHCFGAKNSDFLEWKATFTPKTSVFAPKSGRDELQARMFATVCIKQKPCEMFHGLHIIYLRAHEASKTPFIGYVCANDSISFDISKVTELALLRKT